MSGSRSVQAAPRSQPPALWIHGHETRRHATRSHPHPSPSQTGSRHSPPSGRNFFAAKSVILGWFDPPVLLVTGSFSPSSGLCSAMMKPLPRCEAKGIARSVAQLLRCARASFRHPIRCRFNRLWRGYNGTPRSRTPASRRRHCERGPPRPPSAFERPVPGSNPS